MKCHLVQTPCYAQGHLQSGTNAWQPDTEMGNQAENGHGVKGLDREWTRDGGIGQEGWEWTQGEGIGQEGWEWIGWQ